MTRSPLILAALLAAASLSLPLPAFAQEETVETPVAEEEAPATETPAGETTSTRRPEDNWLKVCDPLEDGERACIMRQVVLNNGQFMGSFLLRDDPGQESRLLAVAAVPLGVLLPFGLTWQIDGGNPIRVPFMLCDPQSCATQLVINEAYVNSLKRGGVLTLTAKNRQNEVLIIEINLSGFTAVYDSEEAITFQQFQQQETGAAALEQVLQDRAEELRRQQAGETVEPAPGEEPVVEPEGEAETPAQ